MGRHLLARGGLDLSLNIRPKAYTKVDKYQSSNHAAPKPHTASNLLAAYPFAAALPHYNL
jgi:hypothetical protein